MLVFFVLFCLSNKECIHGGETRKRETSSLVTEYMICPLLRLKCRPQKLLQKQTCMDGAEYTEEKGEIS